MSERRYLLEPAFPSHGTMGEVAEPGMTLRDYFAAKALMGMSVGYKLNGKPFPPEHAAEVAEDAYIIADAMLAERAK